MSAFGVEWERQVKSLHDRDVARLEAAGDPRYQIWRDKRDLALGEAGRSADEDGLFLELEALAGELAGEEVDYGFLPARDALMILGPGALDERLDYEALRRGE